MINITVNYEPENDERGIPRRLICDVTVSEEDGSFSAHSASGNLTLVPESEVLFEITTAYSDGSCFLAELRKDELEAIEAEALEIYELC